MVNRSRQLTNLAKAGFAALSSADEGLHELAECCGLDLNDMVRAFSKAADPDTALWRILAIVTTHPQSLHKLSLEELERLTLLVGASPALGDFFRRQPRYLRTLLQNGGTVRAYSEVRAEICDAVTNGQFSQTFDADEIVDHARVARLRVTPGTDGRDQMRVRYRELLAELMLYDLEQAAMRKDYNTGDASDLFSQISDALSELAEAAIEASLLVARATLVEDGGHGTKLQTEQVYATPLAVVAMGKCGAEELNVVSDVDVLFVTDDCESEGIDHETVIQTSIRIASETMRAIHDPSHEPPLWQLDANLRPEGKNGPLVRTLGSYLRYYDTWAEAWEFQALLKARQIAGDASIGDAFISRTREQVWASSSRPDFVGTVQRMRERVTEHIDPDEADYELKLGPGGLRDVEFSVQLLQLVHGAHDETLRDAGTLSALEALVDGGYVARTDGEELSRAYAQTRVLEHRLQLRDLRRTARMPSDPEQLRILARSSGFARNAEDLVKFWVENKRIIRSLHQKIFYAPLLNAVAALPDQEVLLRTEAARDRLSSIGFRDPNGALRHLSALTAGTTRRATILRNLLPVLLQWLGEGAAPDAGLISFRRVTEASGHIPWFLRLLRDGTDAAERLTKVLSNSRFISDLLISQPEAVAWLENEEQLWPSKFEALHTEMRSTAQRRDTLEKAAAAIRAIHRREVLRIAMGRIVGVNSDQDVSEGLDSAHTALLDGLTATMQRVTPEYADLQIAFIALGRYGGMELGFSSDLDIVAVYRAPEGRENARCDAEKFIVDLRALVSDPRFTVDLDFDLRPEGKNGALARTIEGYEAYYGKWSLTWEAQALLRARAAVGSEELGAEFITIADQVRFPEALSSNDIREIRTLKARMEGERLPRGADPRRNLKLGAGGISDTEWLVQLIQLKHGHSHPELRTTSTLGALRAAVDAGFMKKEDARHLINAWQFASALRSAEKLWSGKSTDALPESREDLEGIASILGFARGHTTELEEKWFTLSRKARKIFEREFYGAVFGPPHPGEHPRQESLRHDTAAHSTARAEYSRAPLRGHPRDHRHI
ncbi:MAG: bifunctional [glutamine synthetase] adenylyltransferase/[glutamine synthetase]-adenylyl-L-tyrosine phosphorylase [Canibacter sp.]